MKRNKLFAKTAQRATPLNKNTFTGAQVAPDLFSETGYAVLHHASVSTQVNDGVVGRFGMIPPSGITLPTNPSTKQLDGLTGGAGSFMTAPAFSASKYT